MYDIMIIDDDIAIRDHLKSMICWDVLQLNLVCEAGDSDNARELYLIHRPKIVITDINIPIISGIQLAREFIAIDPEIRFIVITGYSDFEYVKDSVALGAVDLLAKPLLPESVNKSLQKAVSYFDTLREEQASSQALKQLLKENIPMLREKYAANLLHPNPNANLPTVAEKLEMLQLDIYGSYYSVALICPDIRQAVSSEIEMQLITTKNTTDELLHDFGFKCFSFYDDRYRLNCILSWDFENGNEIIEETINRIFEKISFIFDFKIYAGIGQQTENLLELSISAAQALEALNYQDVLGTDTIINYKNIARLDTPSVISKSPLLEEFSKQFKVNHFTQIAALLDKYFTDQLSKSVNSLVPLREFAFEYISAIFSASFSLGISVDTIPDYSDILRSIFSCDNAITLKQYILNLTEKLLQILFNKRYEIKNHLINSAKVFIKENLGNEKLSLEMVSSAIGLSSIYFCKLFHKEAGISFNDYLNNQRIKYAKKLLNETNKKVFEISYDVGYSNPKYFNRVFKRIVGITPLEFKKTI